MSEDNRTANEISLEMFGPRDEPEVHPGDIIWQQISRSTKMACGARDAAKGMEGGNYYLSFKVTIKRGSSHFVKVLLINDEYTVILIRTRGTKVTEVERHEGIYCDQLSEVIYHMCNK